MISPLSISAYLQSFNKNTSSLKDLYSIQTAISQLQRNLQTLAKGVNSLATEATEEQPIAETTFVGTDSSSFARTFALMGS